MCGIMAYTGSEQAAQVLIRGLSLLEYRGYDSAGIAVQSQSELDLRRRADYRESVANLRTALADRNMTGQCGVAHTRWATHGGIKVANTHPVTDGAGDVALVHNGIIENHLQLRVELEDSGVRMQSDTDTEVLVLLISRAMQNGASLEDAFRASVRRVQGSSCFVAISRRQPGTVVGARIGNAGGLVVGSDAEGTTVASDALAIPSRYKSVVYLESGWTFVATPEGVKYTDLDGEDVAAKSTAHSDHGSETGKGTYSYFMEKEINEQPASVLNSLRGRTDLHSGAVTMRAGEVDLEALASAERIVLTGMGTSLNCAMLGALYMEQLAQIPCHAVNASELMLSVPVLGGSTPVIGITQSGESADTLEAMNAAKDAGAPLLAVVENDRSEAARVADNVLAINAGREMSVAATKTMTATVSTLLQLAIGIASARGTLSSRRHGELVDELGKLPAALESALTLNQDLSRIAARMSDRARLFYMARAYQYPIAREGALKMKEIAYLHAESFAAGEMKHGILALITDGTPIVAINTARATYKKMLNSISEAKARGAHIIAVLEQGDDPLSAQADDALYVPALSPLLSPIATVIPLQLLAYHTTLALGRNPDRPRNLAKTVTVE